MGVKCQIQYREDGQVERVTAPNGADSILFRDSLRYSRDNNKALNIWATPYTNGYKEINGDWQAFPNRTLDENNEPKLSQVLYYIERKDYRDKTLSDQTKSELHNNMYQLDLNTMEELSQVLKQTFYPSGIFEVTRQNMESSGLYTQSEINGILNNPELQSQIHDTINRMETELANLEGEDIVVNSEITNPSETVVEHTQIGIGKNTVVDPIKVQRTLEEQLAGIKSKEEFDSAVQALPYPSIVETYNKSATVQNEMFAKYSELKSIPVVNADKTTVKKTETAETMKETLLVGESDPVLIDNLEFMLSLDEEVALENKEQVQKVLKDTVDRLIDYNIDVIGLEQVLDNSNYTDLQVALQTTLNLVNKLNRGTLLGGDIDTFSSIMDNLLARDVSEAKNTLKVSTDQSNDTLVEVKNPSTEINDFETSKLIKADNNTYHVVADLNLEQMYDQLYTLATLNPDTLSKEAYYPTAFDSSNTFSESKLKNEALSNSIKSDIRRYILKEVNKHPERVTTSQLQSLEKIVVWKKVYNYALEQSPNIDVKEEFARFNNINSDIAYLENTFPSEFYNYVLQEKNKDSMLYNQVLKHFNITPQGIKVDEAYIQQIRLLTPSNEVFDNLKQYSLASKDTSMRNLYEVEQPTRTDVTQDFYRSYYVNNPTALPLFNKDYDIDSEGILITNNVTDNYLRTQTGTYEKIGKIDSVSLYRKLPISNSTLNNYSTKVEIDTNVDTSKYEHYIIESPETSIETDYLYSTRELNTINQKIDECN